MMDALLFVGLPYAALVACVVMAVYRYRTNRFSYSALSSQFLENRRLAFASIPWHVGILTVLLGHLMPLVAPGVWQQWVGFRPVLLALEAVGVLAALSALVGLGVLLERRLVLARLQVVTTPLDLLVVVLLLLQILLGLAVALLHRWGAAWSAGTLVPYLWSLLTLQPEPAYVAAMPPLVKLHVVMAFLLLLVLPFSRLVHLFSLPIVFLWRLPQLVIWTNPRRQAAEERRPAQAERRLFLKASVGLAGAFGLLSVGALGKLTGYFRKPEMTAEEEAHFLRTKIERLKLTAEQRELELERLTQPYIRVAQLAELTVEQGKYFIDYAMRPALAFKGADGLPHLISAKCTHLGCTVSNTVDAQGRILCPCHMSFFNLQTGVPDAGAPAKLPLPRLGWVLMNGKNEIVAKRLPSGEVEGRVDPAQAGLLAVCIAKEFEREGGV